MYRPLQEKFLNHTALNQLCIFSKKNKHFPQFREFGENKREKKYHE